MLKRILLASVCAVGMLTGATSVNAAVTAEQAAQLGTTLTPLGGEMAGNAAGTIPAWTGGYTTVAPGETGTGPLPVLFAGEQKVLTINSSNVDQYSDKLTAGVIQMIKTYPGFHIDVYPTHRTAAAPQWVYDNTKKNATNAKLCSVLVVCGAYGGIPFPIPQSGLEIAWNSNLRWAGYNVQSTGDVYLVAQGGAPVLSSAAFTQYLFLYYDPNGSLATYKGYFGKEVDTNTAPPNRNGEVVDGWISSDQDQSPRKVWQYLVGQRRLRLAPNIAYDGAYPDCSGLEDTDEVFVFNGQPDHYNWNIVGKKELYVPYNNNAMTQINNVRDILGPQYVDPDKVRWELHRVWQIDMTVKAPFRNIVAHRVIYADEDTWQFLIADEYDTQGHLWKANMAFPYVNPLIPSTTTFASALYDLTGEGYCAIDLSASGEGQYSTAPVNTPESAFDPESIAANAAQ